jgi:hypothetical protein
MTQDVLLVVGVACLIGGVGMIFVPAALILAGLLSFGFVYLIEKSNRIPENKPAPHRRQSEDLPPGIVNR